MLGQQFNLPLKNMMLKSINKNTLVGGSIAFLVIVVGAFFFLGGGGAFDTGQFAEDEAELSRINSAVELFSRDSAILDEIDQTFVDITDEAAGISAGDALSESSINQEALQIDLSQTLDDFAADDTMLQELDQSLGEISQ